MLEYKKYIKSYDFLLGQKKMKLKKECFILSLYRICDSIFRYLTGGSGKRISYAPKKTDSNRTLIVLPKGMGDFILSAFYLEKMLEHYSRVSKVFILADDYNYEFYKLFIKSKSSTTNVIMLSRKDGFLNNYEHIKKYRQYFTRILYITTSTRPCCVQLFRICSPFEQIVFLSNKIGLRHYSILDYKLFKASKLITIKQNFFAKIAQEYVMKLTGQDFGLKILRQHKPSRILQYKYFVVNISANNISILLSKQKFLQIAYEVSNKTGFTAIIIGDLTEKEINLFSAQNLDFSYVNQHNINDTLSLLGNAQFVITPDTGIYHLTLAILGGPKVIIPTWSNLNIMFEPYPEEFSDQHDRVTYIRMYKNCKECPSFGFKCFLQTRILKKTVHCVNDLRVDFIIHAIMCFIDEQ